MNNIIMICLIVILTCNLLTHHYLSKRIDALEERLRRIRTSPYVYDYKGNGKWERSE